MSVLDTGGLVPRRRDDARPVGAEGGGMHDLVMAAQDRNLLGWIYVGGRA
jgi:hypothetical protein